MLLPLDGLDVTACGEGEGDERDMDVVWSAKQLQGKPEVSKKSGCKNTC